MNKNLLIVGAGTYALLASEIATEMGCFKKIAFVDDTRTEALNGFPIVGTTNQISKLFKKYNNIIVAIGSTDVRMELLEKIKETAPFKIVSLISPHAYVSPSAQIGKGCIIEPMAVVQTACVLEDGCLISAGAVINHSSVCGKGTHVDCNATVAGYTQVPSKTKVNSEEMYSENSSS